jgi:C4-dicarboxylate-specific signal transduction histidine kinase
MQMIGLLTNSITHEIKQPLAAVATNTDAALRWLDHEPANLDEARSALGRISRDSWRAAEVLQAIGDLFAGTARELVPLDIGQLVRDCLAIVDDELRDHRISLTCTLSPSLPQVRGDRVQLQQCVVNLILNAVEAMQREPNRPRKLIIDASVEDDGYVTLKLTDSGPGVDPMIADRLFDTFFTTKPHGKGIGLSICRSIVEAHGGRITAAPACKFGASFHMHLPTATARAT